MTQSDETRERRSCKREGGLKSGFATSVDGAQREACVVGNLSASGALLLVENSDAIPEDIILLIDGEKNRRPAHIVWRRHNAVAVSFITRENTKNNDTGWIFPPAAISA